MTLKLSNLEFANIREENDRLRARVAKLEEALRFYTGVHEPALSRPNEGPWGVNSTDFGEVAHKALENKP